MNKTALETVIDRLKGIRQYNIRRSSPDSTIAKPLSIEEQAMAIVSALQEQGLLKEEEANDGQTVA